MKYNYVAPDFQEYYEVANNYCPIHNFGHLIQHTYGLLKTDYILRLQYIYALRSGPDLFDHKGEQIDNALLICTVCCVTCSFTQVDIHLSKYLIGTWDQPVYLIFHTQFLITSDTIDHVLPNYLLWITSKIQRIKQYINIATNAIINLLTGMSFEHRYRS